MRETLPVVSRRRRRRHPRVRSLQQWLADLGYAPGTVDGIFGRKTDRAVRKFQTDAGLFVDGVVGRKTWTALADLIEVFNSVVPDAVISEIEIIPRSDWGARPPKRIMAAQPNRPKVFIHHAADPLPGVSHEYAEARKHQNLHMDVRGWYDIAYNFLITPTGRILEGRGKAVRPGATKYENRVSYAIEFQGYFHQPFNEQPSEVSLNACGWLIRHLIDEGYLASNVEVLGHQDSKWARTACPGDNLYPRLNDIKTIAGL
jgi:hypothetical protein